MSTLDELLEALGVSAGQGESAWRSADAEDIRDALIAYCATHRLIDITTCGPQCPAFLAGVVYRLVPPERPDWCRACRCPAPTDKPCIWKQP